eukprot:Gb_27145 [translate_table: standard]
MHESSQCRSHPAESTVGICPICLKEKLGKLVFTEKQRFSLHSEVGSSYSCSSSSSDFTKKSNGGNVDVGSTGRISLLIDKDRSKHSASSSEGFVLLSRSKSAAPSRRISSLEESNRCPPTKKKGSFWSFLHFTKKNGSKSGVLHESHADENSINSENTVTEERTYLNLKTFGCKVMRSRSVGCGSRSFSGDERDHPFLKNSIGFSECTPEGEKMKTSGQGKVDQGEHITGRVKCGGLFVGFGGVSSSSAMISDYFKDASGRVSGCHSRGRSWSWAFSSPIRVLKQSKRWSNKGNPDDSTTASSPPGSLTEIDRG